MPRVGQEVAPDAGVAGDGLRERAHGVGVVEVALPDEDVGLPPAASWSKHGPNCAAQAPIATTAAGPVPRQDAEAAHRPDASRGRDAAAAPASTPARPRRRPSERDRRRRRKPSVSPTGTPAAAAEARRRSASSISTRAGTSVATRTRAAAAQRRAVGRRDHGGPRRPEAPARAQLDLARTPRSSARGSASSTCAPTGDLEDACALLHAVGEQVEVAQRRATRSDRRSGRGCARWRARRGRRRGAARRRVARARRRCRASSRRRRRQPLGGGARSVSRTGARAAPGRRCGRAPRRRRRGAARCTSACCSSSKIAA